MENHFVGEYVQVAHADYVIGESTYGDKPDIKTGKKERKNDLDKLKSIMGTKVVINQKDKNKGRIEIEYYSQEELDRLIELMESLRV